ACGCRCRCVHMTLLCPPQTMAADRKEFRMKPASMRAAPLTDKVARREDGLIRGTRSLPVRSRRLASKLCFLPDVTGVRSVDAYPLPRLWRCRRHSTTPRARTRMFAPAAAWHNGAGPAVRETPARVFVYLVRKREL